MQKTSWYLMVAGLFSVSGCVDAFDGSNIHLTLEKVPTPCEAVVTYDLSTDHPCIGARQEDRFRMYYELWAVVRRSAVVRVAVFTVQPHLFADEEIKLDHDRVKLWSGRVFKLGTDETSYDDLSPAEQAWTKNLLEKAEASLAITSFSREMYSSEGPLVRDFYLGNHFRLTFAHNGAYYGQVEGGHPYGQIVLSGATMSSPVALPDLDALMVTIEQGEPDRPNPKPSSLVILSGTATQVGTGHFHVNARSKLDPNMTASFSVLTSLDEEELF